MNPEDTGSEATALDGEGTENGNPGHNEVLFYEMKKLWQWIVVMVAL